MAQGDEDKKPSASDKGKEKAPAAEGASVEDGKLEPKKDKDGKIIEDGKDKSKEEEGKEELSEEDQHLKEELEMLVERLLVRQADISPYKPAIANPGAGR